MIRLQDRDLAIIEYMKEQGWVLTGQISERFFRCRRQCSNRMRRLSRAGIVEKVSLSQFQDRYWHERGILNAVCEVRGKTKAYRLSEKFQRSLGRGWQRASSDFMLAHQILLSKVRSQIEERFPGCSIWSEKAEDLRLRAQGQSVTELPDLIADIRGMKVAVELERKARRGLGKYNVAYDDRFAALSARYNAVLYIVETEDHIKPLMKRSEGLGRIGFCSILNIDQIFRIHHDIASLIGFVEDIERSASK